jgi:tRNA(Ile)-lysidine synthase
LGVLKQVLDHISENDLCKATDKILLAVSGGLDSMVMFHLLRTAGFRIGVAHVNFGLRGEESDGDEHFVSEACQEFGVPVFVKKVDTKARALAEGVSIQMAARDLRYAFFQEVTRENGYDYIATAHHFSDLIESVVLNLIRGTGVDGFRGIAAKKQNVIRPLLFATRNAIREYAEAEGIRWREDATNATDDYPRNFVRHQVIPRLQELNPSFEDSFRDTHERLMGGRAFALSYIEGFRAESVFETAGALSIVIENIRRAPFPAVLLWEIIKSYGFHFDLCKQIIGDHQPGKRFQSPTHELVVDRAMYIVAPKKREVFSPVQLKTEEARAVQAGISLETTVLPREDFILQHDETIAQLDADRLTYPLVWRAWKAGDYFTPLGMQADKKLSDFLIDRKMPFNSKADVTVLESAGEIVWVVGHRINERYKVTEKTRRVLVVRKFP